MSPQSLIVGLYDPVERRRQKHEDREGCDARLRLGSVSKEELRSEVGFFSAIDFSKSKIIRRRYQNSV